VKVGDLVKAQLGFQAAASAANAAEAISVYTGVVVGIEEVTDLFSEKYAITETNTYIRVLCDGQIQTFDLSEDRVEVINEAG